MLNKLKGRSVYAQQRLDLISGALNLEITSSSCGVQITKIEKQEIFPWLRKIKLVKRIISAQY